MLTLVIVLALISVPLLWLNWRDRQRARASLVAADIKTTIHRQLAGDSLVTVEVTPPAPWRMGRIRLMVPRGCQALIDDVSGSVLRAIPEDYELVLKSA